MKKFSRFVLFGFMVLTFACQEAPGVGGAAAPSQAQTRGPVMGSAASNKDVTRKAAVMEEILDGKLTLEQAAARLDEEFKDLDDEEKKKRLAVMTESMNGLPGNVGSGSPMAKGPDRDMIMGRLYFGEHRFIEAAMLFSKILDAKEDYPQARNMLARCFYFLGNPDRTVEELLYILKHPRQGRDPNERYDALFLLGAAVLENKSPSKEQLKVGIWAWENYAKELPQSDRINDVNQGLVRLRALERGETPPAVAGAAGPAAKNGQRVAQLKADATPYQRAIAEGLDALDARNVAAAEPKIREALKLQESTEAIVAMGRVMVQMGSSADAMKMFDAAVAKDAAYMPAYHYRGMAHMLSSDPKGAVANWEHIVKTDPAYAAKFKLDQRLQVAKRMGGQ